MKKILSLTLAVIMLFAMGIPVSAFVGNPWLKYQSMIWLEITLRAEYSRSLEEDEFTVEDFPELELVEVIDTGEMRWEENGVLYRSSSTGEPEVFHQKVLGIYSNELDITLEEALERIAGNPMVLAVRKIGVAFADGFVSDVGDLTGDGMVNARDIILVMKYSADGTRFDESDLKKADLNGDGKVNARDVILIIDIALEYMQ